MPPAAADGDTQTLPTVGKILAQDAEKAIERRATFIFKMIATSGLSVVLVVFACYLGWDYYQTVYKPNQSKERDWKDAVITHMGQSHVDNEARAESDRLRNQEIRLQTDTLKDLSGTLKDSHRVLRSIQSAIGAKPTNDEQGRVEIRDADVEPGPPGTNK